MERTDSASLGLSKLGFIHLQEILLKPIDDGGVFVLRDAFVFPAVGGVDMTMDKVRRAVLVHQVHKGLESHVRQVIAVVDFIGRGMGKKDIESFMAVQGKPHFPCPLFHFLL